MSNKEMQLEIMKLKEQKEVLMCFTKNCSTRRVARKPYSLPTIALKALLEVSDIELAYAHKRAEEGIYSIANYLESENKETLKEMGKY